jgi:hypothetical protein
VADLLGNTTEIVGKHFEEWSNVARITSAFPLASQFPSEDPPRSRVRK